MSEQTNSIKSLEFSKIAQFPVFDVRVGGACGIELHVAIPTDREFTSPSRYAISMVARASAVLESPALVIHWSNSNLPLACRIQIKLQCVSQSNGISIIP